MKVMFISHVIPWPPIGGAKVRIFNLLKKMSEHGIELYFVYLPTHRENDLAKKINFLRSQNIFKEIYIINDLVEFKDGNTINSIRMYFQILMWLVDDKLTFDPKVEELKRNISLKIHSIYKNINADVIHIHDIPAGLLVDLPSSFPMLLDLGDSYSLHFKRYVQVLKKQKILSFSTIKYNIYGLIYVLCEKRLLHKFRIVTVVSDIDRKYLKSMLPTPKARILMIPNGVDTKYFSPRKIKVEEDYPSILFYGYLNHAPNYRAALFLLDDILPKIRNMIKNIKLYIVGANPPDFLIDAIKRRTKYNNNIRTAFNVKDIRPLIKRASIVVIPMLDGTGIKNKILEAMSMGKVVITTSLGTGGLSDHVLQSIVVRDSSQEIAKEIYNMLIKLDYRVNLEKRAYKVIRQEYTWDICVERYKKLYSRIIKTKKIF